MNAYTSALQFPEALYAYAGVRGPKGQTIVEGNSDPGSPKVVEISVNLPGGCQGYAGLNASDFRRVFNWLRERLGV